MEIKLKTPICGRLILMFRGFKRSLSRKKLVLLLNLALAGHLVPMMEKLKTKLICQIGEAKVFSYDCFYVYFIVLSIIFY